jgi:hypothetical protein
MNKYDIRQIELVEFGEQVYHSGLRHKGINGNLYEDILIKYLREDIPELSFFKGQIRTDNISSNQYDILICKKDTKQLAFLKDISNNINVINPDDCLAVVELKKCAYPRVVSSGGAINVACKNFKKSFSNLKYVFVCFRFEEGKNKIENTWKNHKHSTYTDDCFCFWGNVFSEDQEWDFPWINNRKLIQRNHKYLGEYERLINYIRKLV